MRRPSSETIVLMILTAMLASVAVGALLIGPAGAVLAVLAFVGVAHVAGPRLPAQPSADQRANRVLRAQWRESRGNVDVLALAALMGWLVILAALWFVGHDAVASACMIVIAPMAARPKRFLPIVNHHRTEHTMTTTTITTNDKTGTIIVRWEQDGRSYEAVRDEHEGDFAVYETTTGQDEFLTGGDTLHEALSVINAPADVLARVRMRAERIGERAEIDAEANLTKYGQWHVRIVVTDLTAGRFENMLGDIVEGATLIEPWYEDTVDVLTQGDLDALADEAMAEYA